MLTTYHFKFKANDVTETMTIEEEGAGAALANFHCNMQILRKLWVTDYEIIEWWEIGFTPFPVLNTNPHFWQVNPRKDIPEFRSNLIKNAKENPTEFRPWVTEILWYFPWTANTRTKFGQIFNPDFEWKHKA